MEHAHIMWAPKVCAHICTLREERTRTSSIMGSTLIGLVDDDCATSSKGIGGSMLHHSKAEWTRSHKDTCHHLKQLRELTRGINPTDLGSFEWWFNVGEIVEKGYFRFEVPKEQEKRMGSGMEWPRALCGKL